MKAKCRTHERRKPMNDKMTPDKERENCPYRKAIINPFDAIMMVVVRRLDEAYHELKRSKPPAKEAEFALRNARLCFYGELVRQSIETVSFAANANSVTVVVRCPVAADPTGVLPASEIGRAHV